jgi:hypothetical protein
MLCHHLSLLRHLWWTLSLRRLYLRLSLHRHRRIPWLIWWTLWLRVGSTFIQAFTGTIEFLCSSVVDAVPDTIGGLSASIGSAILEAFPGTVKILWATVFEAYPGTLISSPPSISSQPTKKADSTNLQISCVNAKGAKKGVCVSLALFCVGREKQEGGGKAGKKKKMKRGKRKRKKDPLTI